MKYYSKSILGTVRKNNQDAINILENDQMLMAIVCDGMGGHKYGEIASNLLIEGYKKLFENHVLKKQDFNYVSKWLNKGIKFGLDLMNKAAKKDEDKLDMGTTLVLFLYLKKSHKKFIYNVGDSRGYAMEDELKQITFDHNRLFDDVRFKGLTFEEAKEKEYAHLITSCIGPKKSLNLQELFELSNDVKSVLLTTDGAHDFLQPEYINKVLKEKTTLKNKVEKMIKSAINARSNDNISIILIERFENDNY